MRIRQEVYSYKKEICKILGSEWIRIRNIAHKNLLFFRLLHACISKVTNKEKTCFVCEWKFQFLAIFTRSKSKNSMPIPFPWSFWLDMRKCSTKQERLHIKKWKTYGNEITQHSALNPRPEENLQLYKKLARKRFSNSKFLN